MAGRELPGRAARAPHPRPPGLAGSPPLSYLWV